MVTLLEQDRNRTSTMLYREATSRLDCDCGLTLASGETYVDLSRRVPYNLATAL